MGSSGQSCSDASSVPIKIDAMDVSHHKDHLPNGQGEAPGLVGVLYLSGDGAMHFSNDETGEETVVDVVPGRFISWPNQGVSHALMKGPSPRQMLGKKTS